MGKAETPHVLPTCLSSGNRKLSSLPSFILVRDLLSGPPAFCYPLAPFLFTHITAHSFDCRPPLLRSQRDGATRSLDRKKNVEDSWSACPYGCRQGYGVLCFTGRGWERPASSTHSVLPQGQSIKCLLHKYKDLRYLCENPGVAGCAQQKMDVKFSIRARPH